MAWGAAGNMGSGSSDGSNGFGPQSNGDISSNDGWSANASWGGYGSKAGLDSAMSAAGQSGYGGRASAGGGLSEVYGRNPRTGEVEHWGTRSLLGGTMTTPAGYRAGMNLGNVGAYNLGYSGLSSLSHPGHQAYRDAHTQARNKGILSGDAVWGQVQPKVFRGIETALAAGTITSEEAFQAFNDLQAGKFSDLPDAVQEVHKDEISTLRDAMVGTGMYDTGYNDPFVGRAFGALSAIDLQTPATMAARQALNKTAREDMRGIVQNYATPLAAKGLGAIASDEIENPLASGLVSGLSSIPAAMTFSPNVAVKQIADMTELANINQIEIALGLTAPRDWSDLPSTIGDSDSIYYSNFLDDNTATYAAEEDPALRAQRWKILQARKKADPTDSFGLGYIA